MCIVLIIIIDFVITIQLVPDLPCFPPMLKDSGAGLLLSSLGPIYDRLGVLLLTIYLTFTSLLNLAKPCLLRV